jgi:hypothetical protein
MGKAEAACGIIRPVETGYARWRWSCTNTTGRLRTIIGEMTRVFRDVFGQFDKPSIL